MKCVLATQTELLTKGLKSNHYARNERNLTSKFAHLKPNTMQESNCNESLTVLKPRRFVPKTYNGTSILSSNMFMNMAVINY